VASSEVLLAPEIRAQYPFRPHYLPVHDLRYHYVDEGPLEGRAGESNGQGRPILMVHGNPTWSFLYRRLIQQLSGRYRVIAPDHMGCGLSDKPQEYRYVMARHVANREALVLELDLKDITLVVHDWGGPIGLSVAARHPHRFRSLVITNTAGFRSNRMPSLLKLARTPLLGEWLIRGLNAFVLTTLATSAAKPIRGAARAGFLAPYDSWKNRIATARFVQDIPTHPDHPSYTDLLLLERSLGSLRDKKTLILWGERDWVFSNHFRDRFRDYFPEATVRSLPQAHHLLFEDAPEEVAQAIEEHLQ
jgi:pimeloyl-ACP methyl ester carboxylesterase